MKKVLLVEDSRVFGSLIQKSIQSNLEYNVDWQKTMTNTKKALAKNSDDYFIALLDLNLPDAPSGEIVDLVNEFNIPIIVFTSEVSNDIREKIWSKKIIDYVFKDGSDSINYIIQLITNIDNNQNIKILIVDDSNTMRSMFRDLLTTHRYSVLSAENGTMALKLLKENPDIKLMTVDYHMPDINGVELTKQIRKKIPKEKLSIIGISSSEDKWISARFIKSGANDYLSKPFINEEFYCRVTQNIQNLSYIETIKDLANKDFLTGLFNRRYFYEYAESVFRVANQKNLDVNVAIIDIDHFKKVNDTYGHDAGDAVLISVANLFNTFIKFPNIIARFGGEEFAIITIGNNLNSVFEKIRIEIKKTTIKFKNMSIDITISAGACVGKPDNLSLMLKTADDNLYKAKENGRNQVIGTMLT